MRSKGLSRPQQLQGVPLMTSSDFVRFYVICKGSPLGFQWLSPHFASGTPQDFIGFCDILQYLQRIPHWDFDGFPNILHGVPLRISQNFQIFLTICIGFQWISPHFAKEYPFRFHCISGEYTPFAMWGHPLGFQLIFSDCVRSTPQDFIDFLGFYTICKGYPLGFQWISSHFARCTPQDFIVFHWILNHLPGAPLMGP